MQKILMIGMTPPQEGGSERHIYELSSRIDGCGVLTQRGSICKNKIEIPVLNRPILFRNALFAFFALFYSLFLLISPKKRYDLIHIHENLLYFAVPILKLRYNVIVTVHGINGFSFYDNKILWSIFKRALSFADGLIAVNLEDKKSLDKYFSNVTYFPNGVDLSNYNSKSPKIEKKITFIGRIHEQKGIIFLLEAFNQISNRFPDYRLEIIGELNDYAKELQNKFQNKNIIWKGYLNDRKKISENLMSSSCIVLPSLWEGLPLTLFEALASGRPVIVSDIPAFKSVIRNEAVFFKAKDSKDLRKNLEEIIKNKNKSKLYGKRGKALSKEYDWDKICNRMKKLYDSQ